MRSATLSVHGGGSDLPVNPPRREDLVGVTGTRHTHLRETINIDAMFDVLPKVEATRGRVKKVIDLLIVDFQEGALAEELYQITKLSGEREREYNRLIYHIRK